MTRYLLDTNHLGETIGRVSIVRDRVQQLHRQGAVFGTCGPVLCELLVGLALRKDSTRCRKRLDGLLQMVRLWPIDQATAERYAEVYHELSRAGRALSQVDDACCHVATIEGQDLDHGSGFSSAPGYRDRELALTTTHYRLSMQAGSKRIHRFVNSSTKGPASYSFRSASSTARQWTETWRACTSV